MRQNINLSDHHTLTESKFSDQIEKFDKKKSKY